MEAAPGPAAGEGLGDRRDLGPGSESASAAVREVMARLAHMRAEKIWPNGERYLWTDAFGLVLLVSLYKEVMSADDSI